MSTHSSSSASTSTSSSRSSILSRLSHSSHSHSRSHRRLRRTASPVITKRESPRVVLGYGAVSRLPTELGRLCLSSPLIVSSPSRITLARRIQSLLPNLDSRILHSDEHLSLSSISGRDAVISVGGASALGLARGISLRKGIPHICVPTTHSGSDDSPACEGDHSMANRKSLPTVIIYDEEFTISRPMRFSAPSGAVVVPHSTSPSTCRSLKSNTDQWSYIHLPGV